MHHPLEIDFRDMPPSASLAAAIRKRVGRLDLWHPLLGCRVTVGSVPQAGGVAYAAQVRLRLPDAEILASGGQGRPSRQDSQMAVFDAFDAAQRQLEDYIRAQRGERMRLATAGGLLI